jgi:hypothetical protein
MPFINLPPTVSEMFWDLDRRIRALETAFRFNFPNVDFNTSTPTNPNTGDAFYDTYAGLLKYWNGTEWVEIADNNSSPSLITTTNAVLKTTNNNIVYTGSPVTIESQQVGSMLSAYAEILGTTVSNWGTGQIYFSLPVGFPTFAHDIVAPGYILRNGDHFTIFGVLPEGTTDMYLWHPTSNGGSALVDYNSPAVLNTNSKIVLNGVAILA